MSRIVFRSEVVRVAKTLSLSFPSGHPTGGGRSSSAPVWATHRRLRNRSGNCRDTGTSSGSNPDPQRPADLVSGASGRKFHGESRSALHRSLTEEIIAVVV